jgi:hypothetical protein
MAFLERSRFVLMKCASLRDAIGIGAARARARRRGRYCRRYVPVRVAVASAIWAAARSTRSVGVVAASASAMGKA